MNRSIAFLDLASVTGVALWRPGMTQPRAFTWRLPRKEKDDNKHIGRFCASFENNLVSLITLERPDFLCFEAPWVGEHTHQDTARKLWGLAAITEKVAHTMHVDWYEVHQGDIRHHFLGPGARSNKNRRPGEELRDTLKRLTIERCNARGWNVACDDEADADAGLDYSVYTLRKLIQVPWNCEPYKGPLLERARAAP